jgi:hypothetical protein
MEVWNSSEEHEYRDIDRVRETDKLHRKVKFLGEPEILEKASRKEKGRRGAETCDISACVVDQMWTRGIVANRSGHVHSVTVELHHYDYTRKVAKMC